MIDNSLAAYEQARQREDLREVVTPIMEVQRVEHVSPPERGAIRIVGTLTADPAYAYRYIEPHMHNLGYTPLMQEGTQRDEAVIMAMPGRIENSQSRLWLAVLLFVLTVVSTVLVGGTFSSTTGLFDLGLGLAFSAALLSILLAHELGHYLTARRLGVNVSYPFFIPMPFTPIGTMGAFISMKAPPPDRRALLAIAIAGPVAGMLVAIPVLLLGLYLSEVTTFESIAAESQIIMVEGNSLLYAAAKILVFGRFLPDGTSDVLLHPVAWAGWVGLLVTALNLIPAGQLDGGHIFYALTNARIARITTWVVAAILLGLSFLWTGWVVWAILIVVLGQQRAPMLNELVRLKGWQRAVAIAGMVLFLLVFMPAPLSIVDLSAGTP